MTTNATIKIEGARFIVTMDSDRRIIRDGAIMIDGQSITGVGKSSELADVSAERVIDARDMVVTPGFCNGHVHISYAHATRGIFPDDMGPDYLPSVFNLQAAMTEEEEYYTTLLAITELLKYGTTCFLEPGSTKYLDACMEVYESTGCRIVVGRMVVDLPNPIGLPVTSTQGSVQLMEDVIRKFNGSLDGRVQAWAMPFSADFSTPDLLVAAKELADTHQTGMTLHQTNDQASIERYENTHGLRPLEHLDEIGVLGSNLLLAHIIELSDGEMDAMARTSTKGVFTPTAGIKSGAGLTSRCVLPELLERGVCMCLATDAGNNSNLIETMRAMYLAAVLFKDGRQNVKLVPAETALEMATIRGAQALGLDGEIGSIEPGKKADLVLFDTRRPEWQTLFNPVNNLVYNADGRSVHTVLVDGRVVVEDHVPLFVDESELIEKVQRLGEKLLDRTGISFPSRWPVV